MSLIRRHRQAGAPKINIQSTLNVSPDLCKNFSLTGLFGRNGNSYTISTQSSMYIYIHIHHNVENLVGQKK
jgi:hypothetical protein